MTDAEKCKMIAEFEGVSTERYERLHGDIYSPWDYPRDLNATMRAARKLPQGTKLIARSTFTASVERGGGKDRQVLASCDAAQLSAEHCTTARAAFEALSTWLAEHQQ
jgi:hypothetical protein